LISIDNHKPKLHLISLLISFSIAGVYASQATPSAAQAQSIITLKAPDGRVVYNGPVGGKLADLLQASSKGNFYLGGWSSTIHAQKGTDPEVGIKVSGDQIQVSTIKGDVDFYEITNNSFSARWGLCKQADQLRSLKVKARFKILDAQGKDAGKFVTRYMKQDRRPRFMDSGHMQLGDLEALVNEMLNRNPRIER